MPRLRQRLVWVLQEWLSSATKVRKEAQQEYDAAQAAKVAAEAAVQTEKDAREAYQAAKSATKGAAKLLDNPPPLARFLPPHSHRYRPDMPLVYRTGSCVPNSSDFSPFKIVCKPPQTSPAVQQRKDTLRTEIIMQTSNCYLPCKKEWTFVVDDDHSVDVKWHAPLLQETVEVKVNREFLGKKEKFAALGISLDGLLEYTEDDTREPTFEASMFGELFQDMLDTRFGRGLLRSFAVLEKQVRPRA